MNDKTNIYSYCPFPLSEYPRITLAHGGGGRMMQKIIREIFAEAFKSSSPEVHHDSIELNISDNRLAFTTDSFVVNPLFFPGGDIGKLAVYGTVNDLAASGARPICISAAFILEEGLETESLWKIASSMGKAAEFAGVRIVTGDTKVVERGHGHGVYINSSGIGVIKDGIRIHPDYIESGDSVIVNGDLGRHGTAILGARGDFDFESPIESDCAPLARTISELIENGIEIHCVRDLTRGGLAAALNEISVYSGNDIEISEESIPVSREVSSICEILGFDPLYIANEGRFAAFIPEKQSKRALEILKYDLNWSEAAEIGKISGNKRGRVIIKTLLGSDRILDMPSGEQFPRIC